MKIRLLLVGAGVVILLSTVMLDRVNGAKSTPQEFTRDINVIELNDHLADGTAVKVRIQRGKVPFDYPYKGASLSMWGSAEQGKLPGIYGTVITAINVKIGNEETSIPLSAYSDLGDPRQFSLEKAPRGFKLLIEGGDAAGGYNAVLVFKDKNIKSRKVSDGEFPDEVWEETVYSFINLEKMEKEGR